MKTKIPQLLFAGIFGTALAAHAETVVWDGSTDTTWSADPDTTSWSGGTYNDGDDVQFLGSGAGTVTLSGANISPGSILVDSSSDYELSGTRLIGTGSLVKSGTGLLYMNGGHTFSGGATINAGTVHISGASSLGGGALTMNGGFVNTGGAGGYDNLTATELSGSGGIIQAQRRTFTVDQATDTTYAGIIQDEDGVVSTANGTVFTKNGIGTLTLSGNNTYSKTTNVNGGTLEVSGALYSAGTNGVDSNINIGAAGTLDVTGAGSLGSGAVFGGNIANSGTFNYNSTTDQELSGSISGTSNLVKDNSSTLTLTGSNTYTGNTTVDGGTLQIGETGTLKAGDFYAGDIAIAAGATFQYSSNAVNNDNKYNGAISGDGTLIKDGFDSVLRLQGTTSVANIEINQGTLRVQGNADALGGAGTTVTIGASGNSNAILNYSGSGVTYTTKAGIVVGAGSAGTKMIQNGGGTDNVENTNITLNDDVIIDDTGAFTLGGVISGNGGLTKIGSGTTTLSGLNNTYSGVTSVTDGTFLLDGSHVGGDTYTIGSAGIFGGGGSTNADVNFAAGALFAFSATDTLTVTGTLSLDNGFSAASLMNADGSAVDWTIVSAGTYTLIDAEGDFSNISNFGAANQADLGDGKFAYFQNGSLQLVVVPEPGTYALLGGLLALSYVMVRRR